MNKALQAVENQVLRGLVLRITYDAEPLGAGTEVIQSTLTNYGYRVQRDDILSNCHYLEGKGLVTVEHVENRVLNISRDIAHITPKGIDVLEGTEVISGIELES